MDQKHRDLVQRMSGKWSINSVATPSDISAAMDLYAMFDEYHGRLTPEKIKLQEEKFLRRDMHNFLVRNPQGQVAGYTTIQWPYSQMESTIMLDQVFVHPDSRGNHVGEYLVSHFLHFAATTYQNARSFLTPTPKRAAAKHFREASTQDPISLSKIKSLLHRHGFHDMHRKEQYACPTSCRDIGDDILGYLELPFDA